MTDKKAPYVVATDYCRVTFASNSGEGPEWQKDKNAYGVSRLYFNESVKQVTGYMMDATLYDTYEAAEKSAFLLACLDGNLAGHLHIVPAAEARDEARELIDRQQKHRMGGIQGAKERPLYDAAQDDMQGFGIWKGDGPLGP